ncbi:MAG TPA: hypothetical protein VJ872_10560 [Nocardioides sp.]|nr:hypothetical protein [Nocardioides sp.]
MDTATLTTADRFLEAFSAQRYADLADLMTPDARFRALLPPRTLDGGPELLIGCYGQWFGTGARVVSSGVEPAGEKVSVTYSVVVDDGNPRQAEQHLYLSLAGDRISAIDLICSGFHAVSAASAA